MTAHSKIGASSMYRWSACPGSVRLSENVPKTSSKYAEEGSAAHAFAEHCLRHGYAASRFVGQILYMPKDGPPEVRSKIPGHTFPGDLFVPISDDMIEAVAVYLDAVRSSIGVGDTFTFEQRFDLSEVHPGCFGTADAVVRQPKTATLIVYDYKHGAGVPVNVVENPQLKYYALGALLASNHPARRVRMTIVQPRCDHADGPVRSYEIDALDLLDFKADLKAFAEATEKPDAPLVPGDHCRFCPAAALCPALSQRAQSMAKLEFAPSQPYDPAVLKLALDSREPLKAWLKALDEFAYAEAEAGRTPPGYKLVAKRANRDWRDEGDVVEFLQDLGVKPDVIFAPRKVKSPAQLEKAIDAAMLEPFIVKESSGHVLVAASDKRAAVKLDAKSEFA